MSTLRNGPDDQAGVARIIAGGINLGRLQYVDHMVGNLAAGSFRKFGGADVESAVKLK